MSDPIRIEEVKNGFVVESWNHAPSPAEKTTHIFESMDDLLQHILDHFYADRDGYLTIEWGGDR